MAADVHRGDHAAAAVDDRHRHGLQARFQFLRHAGVAVGAHAGQDGLECADVGHGVLGVGLDLAHRQHPVQFGRGQARQQHAAHRRHPGRQAAAHGQVDGHDLVRGQTQDVDDVGAFQHRHRARLARLLGHFFHVGQRQVPQRRARQVGVAQLKDARGQRELAVLDRDVAQVLQRQQDAARAGAGQAGHGRDLGQRHLGTIRAERPDHGQAARKRLNVAVAGLLGCLLGHPSTARKNVAAAGNPGRGGSGRAGLP
jgi:hypothetical protein